MDWALREVESSLTRAPRKPTFKGMKTVSIEKLPVDAQRMVQEAIIEEIVVTQNGRPLAVLRGFKDSSDRENYWSEREQKLAVLRESDADSTQVISEDRDRG
jgi:hypothetical protein